MLQCKFHANFRLKWDRWDEMGEYDIPACIEYMMEETGQKKVSYIGHSLGCSLFFIAMIQHPYLSRHIDVMMALGPASSIAHLSGLMAWMAPAWRWNWWNRNVSIRFQNSAFFANQGVSHKLQQMFCDSTLLGTTLCRNYLFTIFGHNTDHFNLVSTFSFYFSV